MSAATLTRPAGPSALVRGRRLAVRGTVSILPAAHRRPTLDDLLVGVWEGLLGDREVGCPVCGGAMRAARRTGRPPVAGSCGDCGSTVT